MQLSRLPAVALLAVVVGCGGGSAGTGPGPTHPTATCPKGNGAATALAVPDEATIKAMSRAYVDALDRGDSKAFAAAVTPTFISFVEERFLDKATIVGLLDERASAGRTFTRDWKDERVVLGTASVLYAGLSTEHRTGGDGHPIDEDGWYALTWVPDGDAWRLANSQWQKGGIDVEREMWNGMYRAGIGFEPKPNQLLVDTVKGKKPGTALDIGMGQGRNTIFLAEKKWKVTGIDIADDGIRIAQETAAKKKLKIDAIQADMTTWDFGTAKWDLIAMVYEGADHAVIEKAKAGLKPGGVFVLEFFTDTSDTAKMMSIGGVKPGELAELFKDGFTIVRDDVLDDVADWGMVKDNLARFVAIKNK